MTGIALGSTRERTTAVLTALAALCAAAAALMSGMSMASGSKAQVVLPIAVVVAVIIGVLAVTRFAAFVMVILAIRASIDLSKLSGHSAGNTATNTVARGLDPESILAVLFLLASILWVIAQYHANGRLPGSRLRLTLLAFCAAGAISILGSGQLLASIMDELRILAVVMMFVVLEQIMTDRKTFSQVLVAAYASLLFPLGYTTLLFALGHPPSEQTHGFTRITGPFTQSTTFGRYLMFMLIFGVAVHRYLRGRTRLAMRVLLVISALFLVLTLTLSVVIGAFIGLLVVGIATRNKRLLGTLLVGTLLALVLLPALSSRLTNVGTSRQVGGAPTGNTFAWRLDYWTQVLPLANKNPLTGIGIGTTQYQTTDQKQPHNDFIRFYVETGVIGVIAYTLMLGAFLRTGMLASRRAPPDTFDRGVAVGYLGCAVAFVAISAASNVMSNVVTLWYLVTFAAAASVIARRAPSALSAWNEPAGSRSRPVPVLDNL